MTASLPARRTRPLKPVALLAALLHVVLLLSACGPNGEDVEVCRRYMQLVDQTREGAVSPDEYFQRVQPEQMGEFEEGSSLRQLHEDLIEALEDEDLDGAQTAEEGLQDECMGVLNQ